MGIISVFAIIVILLCVIAYVVQSFSKESFIPNMSTINKSLDAIDDEQKDTMIKGVHNHIDHIQTKTHDIVDSLIPCLLKTKSCDKKLDYGIFGKSPEKINKETNMDTYAVVPPITTNIVIPRPIPVMKAENNDIVFMKS
uniref:Uncharacterized protein n=1 Tax=viral metagenome TaxID=1070528 RepID=A0A6C0CMT2_9ZZZZ